MRASVSSDEIASARISCSERSLRFLATVSSTVMTQGREYYSFVTSAVGEGGGLCRARIGIWFVGRLHLNFHAFGFGLTFRGRRPDCQSGISLLELFWRCRRSESQEYSFAR